MRQVPLDASWESTCAIIKFNNTICTSYFVQIQHKNYRFRKKTFISNSKNLNFPATATIRNAFMILQLTVNF